MPHILSHCILCMYKLSTNRNSQKFIIRSNECNDTDSRLQISCCYITEMERCVAKLLGLILTFLLPFIATVLPYYMAGWIEQQGDRGKRILCLLMCFGGGIFLATYLLHMGPEVRQDDKTSSYISIIQWINSTVDDPLLRERLTTLRSPYGMSYLSVCLSCFCRL